MRKHIQSASMGILLSCLALGQPLAVKAPESAPDDRIVGVPWTGAPGITETVAQIMARQALLPAGAPAFVREVNPENEVTLPPKHDNPDSPAVSKWPPQEKSAPEMELLFSPQSIGVNFKAISLSETPGYIPPDSMGDVGIGQVLTVTNGRIKVFAKSGALGGLNADLNTFFNSVRGSSGTSDPHIRYDRLSSRWFVSCITVNTPNHVLLAVSSGPTISSSSSFTFFQFQQDLVGTTPNSDTGGLADYDTLGVDKLALYIGSNIFNAAGTAFIGSTGFVVNKTNLIGGTLTVTAFRQMTNGGNAGPYTPQGVNNDDPQATQGYFIGVDALASGQLDIRRVSNPGGTPTLSGNLIVTVPTTTQPIPVPHLGMASSTRRLAAIDERLFAAAIHKNKITGVNSLWTAHTIEVDSSGVGTSGGGRDGARWYEIRNMTTTPTLFQSGTLFDPAASNPRFFWMPSVAMSGQGHMALGSSTAGVNFHADAAVAGRLFGDSAGSIQAATLATTTSTSYNIQAVDGQRWGDYSQVGVDPSDDMTFWTFREYCDTTNSWGVRAIQLLPFPPATPSSTSPSAVCPGNSSVAVTVIGTSTAGSGFFDPGPDTGGPGYLNHLQASVSGGIPINPGGITFNDGTHVTLNISTSGIPNGSYDVTITNPDGQVVTGSGVLTVANSTPPSPTASYNPPCPGGTLQLYATTDVLNATFSWTGPNGFTSSQQNPTVTPAAAGTYTVTMTAGGCVASPASTTVAILNNGDPCNDNNPCTVNDACSGSTCTGPALDCNDNNTCTTDSCNPASGCVHTTLADGTHCSDGNACTTSDKCSGGVCVGGAATNCNDNNACTDDSCVAPTGCVHVNNAAPCSDGNACTTSDACSGGACVGGPPLNCNDGNPCTTDTCNTPSGCVHTNNAIACDDGNPCTTGDHCGGGACSGTPVTVPQITNLVLPAGNTTLAWDSASGAGPGTVYDAARGLTSELPVGSGASEICLASGITNPTTMDGATPPVGASFWYIVRARSSCGTGGYGFTSGGSPEVTSVCP